MRSFEITSAFASNHIPASSIHLQIRDHNSNKAYRNLISHKTPRKSSKLSHRTNFQPPPNLVPRIKTNQPGLSKDVVNSILHSLKNTWSPSTFSAYSRSIKFFTSFCNTQKIPAKTRFPASEFLLCAFAASKAGHLSGKTIQNHLTALKAWHHIHNVEWKGGTYLRLVMKGINNLTPLTSKKPPRLVIGRGNPGVTPGLPLPLPPKTLTLDQG
jgi:hypothetical protein